MLFSLAKRRAALLVAHYQPEIQALARELEPKLILPGSAAREVFMRSLTKRRSSLAAHIRCRRDVWAVSEVLALAPRISRNFDLT